ncbi:YcjX family protein [Vibrio amylolyticus]|uniref:YcjX family protein n=1 Tax=Vibrio amylolyticus TaxID=2847292 RepID=UPI00354EA4EF
MKKLGQEMSDFLHRSTDSHVRVAITGLSRAGKTAFITSMVDQLLHTSTHDNLPLLHSARDKRIIGAKRVPQSNMMVPRFAYDEAVAQLASAPPEWPVPTKDVSEIRLAIKYKPKKRHKKLLGSTSTLYLDIIDYPGEWLLDLPLLDLSFEQWSETQFDALTGTRKALANEWMGLLDGLDLNAIADERKLEAISQSYTQYLHDCKKTGLHWVQPGRFVLPGDLEGAPVLQFFPYPNLTSEKALKNSNLDMLKKRYQEYQQKVVKTFYRQYFSTFDRQVVLVDCLSPLNESHESFRDMSHALEQIMHSFQYGRSGLLKRLFSPKIDKVLFAATKADHVTPEQHPNLVSLLQQLIHPAWQNAAFENIEMNCIAMSSIQATTSGFVNSGDSTVPAIQGETLENKPLTVFPGEVPKKLPSREYWQESGFEFTSFRPKPKPQYGPSEHIRMDKALETILGDKLK